MSVTDLSPVGLEKLERAYDKNNALIGQQSIFEDVRDLISALRAECDNVRNLAAEINCLYGDVEAERTRREAAAKSIQDRIGRHERQLRRWEDSEKADGRSMDYLRGLIAGLAEAGALISPTTTGE